MQVTVKFFAGWGASAQRATWDVALPDGATFAALKAEIARRDPELHRRLEEALAAGYVHALLDGRNVRLLDGDRTVLVEGATVAFLPPVSGG